MGTAAGRSERPPRVSVWLDSRTTRGTSARRPEQPSGLDRDRITRATVELLDAEGLVRFSMRRLAARLNVTAMSVYWYVDTKEDLLELALDAAFGELALPAPDLQSPQGPQGAPGPPPPGPPGSPDSPDSSGSPDPLGSSRPPDSSGSPHPLRSSGSSSPPASPGSPEDWREQLRALAGEYRALLVRHPWMSALVGRFLNIGPRSMALSSAVRQIVRGTGLPGHEQPGATSAVFQFVYGFGTIEGHFIQRCAQAGLAQDEYVHEAAKSITAHPEVAAALRESTDFGAAQGGEPVAVTREREFAFALDLLVAGIEAMVARR